jgi:uncharacterized protein with von Willebrand factor type A (vWA) domain
LDKVTCALLLDVTGSMEAFLPVLKNAVVQFVDALREEEKVGVYTFNTSLQYRREQLAHLPNFPAARRLSYRSAATNSSIRMGDWVITGNLS